MSRIGHLRTIARWVRAGLDAAQAEGADDAVAAGLYGPLCLAVLNAGQPSPSLALRARKLAYTARKVARFALRPSDPVVAPRAFALVLPRLANHRADLLPLTAALEARGHTVVVAEPEAMTADGWTTARALAAEALQPLVGCFRYDALAHATPRALRAAVRATVVDCLPTIVAYRCAVRERIARHRPRLIVIGNPNVLEGSVAGLEARRAGIPTVALQHGTVVPDEPMWWGCPVDRVLAWGDDGRARLLSCGLAPSQVEAVGCLRLDAVLSRFRRTPRAVLVASSGAGHHVGQAEQREFVDAVFGAAKQTPELPWVVKLHPKDDPALYRAAEARWGCRVRLVLPDPVRKGLDIFEHLREAVALVTISSAAGLDALAVGVPVISVRPRVDVLEDAVANAPFLHAAQTVVGAEALAAAVRQAAAGQWKDVGADVAALFSRLGNALPAAVEACERLASGADAQRPRGIREAEPVGPAGRELGARGQGGDRPQAFDDV